MNQWQETHLGAALDVRHGFAFKGEHFRESGDVVVLTPGNFYDEGGFKPKGGKEKYYDGPYPSDYLLARGDVVIAMTEQSLGLLGSSATVPESDRYLHNQRIGLVRITNPNLLDLRYAYHLMNSPIVRRQIQVTATGAKIRHTAPERIKAVKVALPDLRTQRIVAMTLDAIDDLIANNQRRAEVLKDTARAIYREWFVHFRYPSQETVSLGASTFGLIPDGWRARPFTALGTFTNGFAFKPSNWGAVGRPIIKIKELKDGVSASTPRCAEGAVPDKYRVELGDLIFSWSADLGVYQWAGEPGLLNQHLFIVKPLRLVSSSFLLHALEAALPHFWARAQGTTMRHIKRAALTEVQTPEPGADLVELFTSVVEPLDQEKICLQQSARNLADLRKVLLPKLLSGQIDVSSLDLDALIGGLAA